MKSPSDAWPRTLAVIEAGLRDRHHLGVQLFVALRGQVVADLALGEARPGVPMQGDTIVPWMSSGKPLTAVALAQLQEQGRLAFDDPVARHLPEFAQRGKEGVLIAHLLTHTAGLRGADSVPEDLSWDDTLRRICESPLDAGAEPGQQAGYHRSASWFVLAEIVRRLSGKAIAPYLHEHICRPLGLVDCSLGLSADDLNRLGQRVGWMFVTHRPEPTPHNGLNSAAACAAVRPGSNLRGPIRELGRFYEHLRALWGDRTGELPGLVQPSTLRRLTERHRAGMFDETMCAVMDWGYGFLLQSPAHADGRAPYGFGRYASPNAFGHGGAQSSCGFADPDHQLAVAWLCNGLLGEARHQQRAFKINSALYEDLSLA